MATEAELTSLIGALKADMGVFQTLLEEAWPTVKGETKPIWPGEDNTTPGDKVTRLNAAFNLKAFIEANRALKVLPNALAELETIRGNIPLNDPMNKGKLYRLTNTITTIYDDLKVRLAKSRWDNYAWFPQWQTRVSKTFEKTVAAKGAIAEIGADQEPNLRNNINKFIREVELKAYAVLITAALDRGIQQLLRQQKEKPEADNLLSDKNITGIYALQFIANKLTTEPNQQYLTWLVIAIDTLYRANWSLFQRTTIEYTTKTLPTFKYVYNQLPIIGYAGLRPTSMTEAGIANACLTLPRGIISKGRIGGGALIEYTPDTSRDSSLGLGQYDPIDPNMITEPAITTLIERAFPDALKAAASPPPTPTPPTPTPPTTPPTSTSPSGPSVDITDPLSTDSSNPFGLAKLPPGDPPANWKGIPIYKAYADKWNLINYAAATKKDDGWITTMLKELASGCIDDPHIMTSKSCPTIRSYLWDLAITLADGSFSIPVPETPDHEDYGNVTIKLTIKLSDMAAATSITDPTIAAADPALQPILLLMKQIEKDMAALFGVATPDPSLVAIGKLLADITKDLTALGITI